jgi:hypothetical protein
MRSLLGVFVAVLFSGLCLAQSFVPKVNIIRDNELVTATPMIKVDSNLPNDTKLLVSITRVGTPPVSILPQTLTILSGKAQSTQFRTIKNGVLPKGEYRALVTARIGDQPESLRKSLSVPGGVSANIKFLVPAVAGGASTNSAPAKTKQVAATQPAKRKASANCPCGGGTVCIGPRGGRYCIAPGGGKRYVRR